MALYLLFRELLCKLKRLTWYKFISVLCFTYLLLSSYLLSVIALCEIFLHLFIFSAICRSYYENTRTKDHCSDI